MDNLETRAANGSGLPRLRITLLGVAVLAFGLLIWSRLLLVTNYPKTAIADPPAVQGPERTAAPGSTSAPSSAQRR